MAKRYEEEFKKQLVALYNNGQSLADLNREYEVAKSSLKQWIERYNETKSFNVDDNRTKEEKELIKYKKDVKNLKWKMIF